VESDLSPSDDFLDFSTLETLTRKAGVPTHCLARLVIKELVDNALDAGAKCRCLLHEDGRLLVEDDGPGIPGTDEQVADLFSIGRPQTSSKRFRRPTRGALGNGLRVVAGAVLASGGRLSVRTRGRWLLLEPRDDGTTRVTATRPVEQAGTRILLTLGPALACGPEDLVWGKRAIALAGYGTSYEGQSSPYWYSDEAFWKLLRSTPALTVRALVARLEGCGGKKASDIAAGFINRDAAMLNRAEASSLLATARECCRPVNPARLGAVGPLGNFAGYKPLRGVHTLRLQDEGCAAEVPFAVEAWAARSAKPRIEVCINRTPVTADARVFRDPDRKTDYYLYGCNVNASFSVGRGKDFRFLVNVQAPVFQHTTDGKEPDLGPVADTLLKALRIAAKQAGGGAARGMCQKAIVRENLDDAIAKASGGGKYRYSLRQLFYAIRPVLLDQLGREPRYGTFAGIITELEAERGRDLPRMYRDTRGTLYHPHSREWIPVGTLSMEKYRRPEWTFNKILYCEKEGLFPALTDDRWPERHDCALLTSKGYATRAARDALDLLGETDEPLTFFCIHDADGPGTVIFQSLVSGTAARAERKVKVVNLGLEPAEARRMGLAVETVHRDKKRKVPVADYVSDADRKWLQNNRVELNAMTTPEFIDWLERGIADYHENLVPPDAVLRDRLQADVRGLVKSQLTEQILRDAGLESRIDEAVARLAEPLALRGAGLNGEVCRALADLPDRSWWSIVGGVAKEILPPIEGV
jgi:hypothetical protein